MEAAAIQSQLNEAAYHSLSPLPNGRMAIAPNGYLGRKRETRTQVKYRVLQGVTERAKTRCMARPKRGKQPHSRRRRELSVCETIWLRSQVVRALTLYFRLYYRAETLGIDRYLEDTLIFIQDVTMCLDDLDSGSRQIIWSLFWEGRSQIETANRLELNPGLISNRTAKILMILQNRFMERGVIRNIISMPKPTSIGAG